MPIYKPFKNYDIVRLLYNEIYVSDDYNNNHKNRNKKGINVQDIASLLKKTQQTLDTKTENNTDTKTPVSSAALLQKQVQNVVTTKHIATTKIANYTSLIEQVKTCTRCELYNNRNVDFIASANKDAKIMFVGEFSLTLDNIDILNLDKLDKNTNDINVLLYRMILAMKLDPMQDVYVTNAIKCAPLKNRMPDATHLKMCNDYLINQIDLIKPKVIIALGRLASMAILKQELAIEKLRGKIEYHNQIPVITTYSPEYLLKHVDAKKNAWIDLQLAMKCIDGKNINN